ncbi:hypothetical protein HaLaN_29433 [Haematococcus lacustris]|uniref:Uncharacterized protein n=1 Tax=Haematococcus lacustris TaxID=44745 RepID=A0A6A0AER1_HAELA|nr:hypothetical protein HaLaN_29433 [Haematococcus lacustris]
MIASASLTRGSTAALLLLTLLGAASELGAESGLLRPLNSVGGRQLQQASDAEDHDRSIRFSTCRAHTGNYRYNNLHVFRAQPGICSLEAAALKAVTVASAIGRDECNGPTFIAKAGQEYLVVSEAVTQPNQVIMSQLDIMRVGRPWA